MCSLSVDAPSILMSPRDQYVLPGDDVVFTVNADGFGITYQWFFEGMELNDSTEGVSGATTPNLALANVSASDFGSYFCVVSSVVANRTSGNATLAQCEYTTHSKQ